MALGPLDPSSPKPHTPKLPGLTPGKSPIGKVGDDLGKLGKVDAPKGADDASKPKDNPNVPPPSTHTVVIANNVQAYDQTWSELPQNLFSNAGSGTIDVSSIPRVSSLPESDELDDVDSAFQILELDSQTCDADEGLDGAELDLEVSLGLTQLDANDRNGAQELASLMAGFDAFRQGQYLQAYRLDPNSFTAYKTIKT